MIAYNTKGIQMRKLIILAVSLVVVAAVIANPLASAVVSYDPARVGHEDKGDVRALFG